MSRRAPADRSEVPPHRWIGIAALGLAIGLLCSLLGSWQWSRYEDRSAAVDRITTNLDSPVVPLAELVQPGAPLELAHEWRSVRVRGTYLAEHTVLLRNRPVSGQTGFHVLVPLRVDAGGPALLVVDRGWVPGDTAASEVPAPPGGTVEVTVRLRPSEPESDRGAPAGQVQAIAVAQVLEAGGAPPGATVYDAYGVLTAEQPSPAEPVVLLPRPSVSLGSNLSYALQWWALALGGVVALGVVAYRERREVRRGTTGTNGMPTAPPARRRRRRPTAEEEEDALLDAAAAGAAPLTGAARPDPRTR